MSTTRLLAAAALAAGLILPGAAFAQTAPLPAGASAAPAVPGAHHHRGGLRAALRGLHLSSAQDTQIRQAFAQTRAANRNADPATRKANRAKLRSEIDAILTPAQRAQLQTALQRHRRA